MFKHVNLSVVSDACLLDLQAALLGEVSGEPTKAKNANAWLLAVWHEMDDRAAVLLDHRHRLWQSTSI